MGIVKNRLILLNIVKIHYTIGFESNKVYHKYSYIHQSNYQNENNSNESFSSLGICSMQNRESGNKPVRVHTLLQVQSAFPFPHSYQESNNKWASFPSNFLVYTFPGGSSRRRSCTLRFLGQFRCIEKTSLIIFIDYALRRNYTNIY